MKVKLLVSLMSGCGVFAADTVADIPDDIAKEWISKEMAVAYVDEKPKAKPKKEEVKVEVKPEVIKEV